MATWTSLSSTKCHRAARTACRASKPTLHVAGLYAVRAAYHSTALVHADHQATLDAVVGNALHAHTLGTGGTMATPIVELTRHATRSWRSLAAQDSRRRLDSNADRSAEFLSDNLPPGTTQARIWQFRRKRQHVVSDKIAALQQDSTEER